MMKTLNERLEGWRVRDGEWTPATASRKSPAIPLTAPEIARPTRIRRISKQFGFWVNGQEVPLGAVVWVTASLAHDLVYRGKAELFPE